MARGEARERLLERAIDHISRRGLTDLSLRELAAAIGTSHRMLIHHFGGKEGLWVEVIRTVEARQRELMPDIAAAVVEDPAQATRDWWRHISDPSLWPNERLFFEVYGQALQGRPGTTELLDGIIDSWLDAITDIYVGQGLDRDTARARGRLSIAVTRGLLLDLLATGDRPGTDAAMEQWIALNEAALGSDTV